MNRLFVIAVIIPATGCPVAKQSVSAAKVAVTPQVTGETTPDSVPWAKVGEPVKIGDTKITLLSVRVGKLRVKPVVEKGEERDAEDEALIARIRINNLSATKDLKYSTYQGVKGVSLRDERGTEYFVVGAGYKVGWDVVGSVGFWAHAEAGESFEDLLWFKPPLPAAKTFRLTLPEQRGSDLNGNDVDGPVPFRFEFTRDDLKK